MASNMPDSRAMEDALRRARALQQRAQPSPNITEPDAPAPTPPVEPPAASPPAVEDLWKDKERMLLLALLILLYSEGAGADLLFALMYLLI